MAKRKPTKPKATVADLLGARRTGVPGIPRKWRKAYDRLVELRNGFRQQQSSLAQDAGPTQQHTGMHMADVGTDASERDLALGLISFDSDTVHQIDMAIERIRNGTYGVCELTGKPISAERLKAIPWTRFSAKAEQQIENNGGMRSVGAGRRETVTGPAPDMEETAESDSASD